MALNRSAIRDWILILILFVIHVIIFFGLGKKIKALVVYAPYKPNAALHLEEQKIRVSALVRLALARRRG